MKRIVTFILMGLLSVSVFANEKWYGGVSVGQTEVEGIQAITASVDDSDTGYKFLVGYKIDNNISIEAQYTDLGDVSISGTTGQTFVLDGVTLEFAQNGSASAEADSFGISGLYSFPANNDIDILLRVGLHSWDSEASGSGITVSDDGTDLFYGVGIEFDTANNIAIRGEYEIYDFDGRDVNLLSIGAVFNF